MKGLDPNFIDADMGGKLLAVLVITQNYAYKLLSAVVCIKLFIRTMHYIILYDINSPS